MKKRMLALALAAAMMVGVLTSCSNGGSTSGGTSGNSSDGALNITWGRRYAGRNHSASEHRLCLSHSR